MKTTRGFTLVELLVALVLMGIVSGGILFTLNKNRRVYQAQVQTMKMQDELRAATFVLPNELRELDASDGDIVAMSANDITIKIMRRLGFLCLQPVSPWTAALLIERNRQFGIRWFDPTRDSLLILAVAGPGAFDDQWLRASISTALQTTGTCTGGAQASTLTVTVAGGAANLSKVTTGSPVRGFELQRLRLFQDADTRWYLGVSNYVSGAWTATQAIAGPLTATGVQLQYFDSTGTVTANRFLVRSVGVTVRGVAADATQGGMGGGGGLMFLGDSLVTRVALRNNAP